jgi:CubicO group peptidase (beta-lactamase class C family)
MQIHGKCDERFAQVRDEFEKNFTERGDIGACFAATLEGEYVVDIWGGHADAASSRPWLEDTIVNVYSTTKTMAALTALMLADRGVIDLHAPVARYWPEFGQNGKAQVTTAHFLSHSAGLPAFAQPRTAEQLYDWDSCVAMLAAQAPLWEPGKHSGYHAITQGYLIGEVVRRVSGKSLGQFFRDEVARPMGADFHIGTPVGEFARIADLLPAREAAPPMQLDPESIPGKVFSNLDIAPATTRSEGWRRAEIPAANGHGNARSVVRAQSALVNGGSAFGVELLSQAGCRRVLEEQTNGPDLVLGLPIRFGMGYGFPGAMLPVSPSKNAAFWGGAGGSTIVVDYDQRLCFSYVMNQMNANIIGDPRGGSLGQAVYRSLGIAG